MGKTVGQTIRAEDAVWERVKAEAEHRGLTVNDWVRMVIADALNGEHYVLVARKPENIPERMRETATTTRPPAAQPPAAPAPVVAARIGEARSAVEAASASAGGGREGPRVRRRRLRLQG